MSVATVPPQAQPNHLRRCVILWAVLSVLGMVAAFFGTAQLVPTSASDAERFANVTIVVFTVASVPVAFFVWVFMGYSLTYFRVKGQPVTDGPALQPRTPAQIAWVSISGVLCAFLFIWGLFGIFNQASARASKAMTVNVVGQQWTWTFHYPKYHVTTHRLELPVNQAVLFRVTSLDVLHGFSIAELGVRQDANPGQWIALPVMTPNRKGRFTTRCVELCGTYHTFMTAPVNVVNGNVFRAWLKKQGAHV